MIRGKNIKHKLRKLHGNMFVEYEVEIGTLKINFGQYTTEKFRVSKTAEYLGMDSDKEFRTSDACRKYILKFIATWINANVKMDYTPREERVGLLRFPNPPNDWL